MAAAYGCTAPPVFRRGFFVAGDCRRTESDDTIFPMIRLIVTADDLGAGAPTDRGIFVAYERGIVTGTSLMANGPSFSEAAMEARRISIPLGVHFNLSEGSSLTGCIPGLTDGSGAFPGKMIARRRLTSGAPCPRRLLEECTAQVERILESGLKPLYFDSHQHSFLFTEIQGILLEVARTFGIPAARLPVPAESPSLDPPGPLGKELALYRRLAPAAKRTLIESGLGTPDGLWGMPLLDRIDIPTLLETLANLPAGSWELMTHPGFCDIRRPFGGKGRELEVEALCSSEVRSMVRDLNIDLISFGELSCAF